MKRSCAPCDWIGYSDRWARPLPDPDDRGRIVLRGVTTYVQVPTRPIHLRVDGCRMLLHTYCDTTANSAARASDTKVCRACRAEANRVFGRDGWTVDVFREVQP